MRYPSTARTRSPITLSPYLKAHSTIRSASTGHRVASAVSPSVGLKGFVNCTPSQLVPVTGHVMCSVPQMDPRDQDSLYQERGHVTDLGGGVDARYKGGRDLCLRGEGS
eukprot:2921326-Rhodomonas_salina.1